jgi:hypothetical protein
MYNTSEIARWPSVVRTMDTVKPFKAAYFGYKVEDMPRGLGKWNTRMKLTDEQEALLYRNLAYMHRRLTR